MKKILLLSLIIALIASCTQRVYMTISDPPAVYLEKEYETAGVINRSFSKGPAKVLDVIDNAMGLEGNIDAEGSNAAVRGMFDELTTNPRFKFVTILDSIAVDNRAADIFPAPMEWTEVERICQEQGVQLLFVLEVFDTDSKIDYDMDMVNQTTPLGTIQVPRHTARMTTRITTGWRIYDPKNKRIRDEFFLRDKIVNTGSGINPVKAASVLVGRGQAVKQLSTQVGRFYAGRVNTKSFRVWRDYYNKGSRNLRIAKRRSEVGDWDGAAEMWLKDTESPKRKVAGRACYNMGISNEINGNVYEALDWVQKAYSDYNNKEAKRYAQILRNRIFLIEKAQALDANDN